MSLYKKRHFLLVGFMSGLLIFALLLSAIVGGTSALDMNSRFDRYVEELFRQEVSANTITLHYTVKDPESTCLLWIRRNRLGAYMCFCGKCSCKPSSVQTEQAV